MGFSIFCIVEACILIANAIAILNDRFLKQGKSHTFLFSDPSMLCSRFPRGQRELSASTSIRSRHESRAAIESSGLSEPKEPSNHLHVHIQEVYEVASHNWKCIIHCVRTLGGLNLDIDSVQRHDSKSDLMRFTN